MSIRTSSATNIDGLTLGRGARCAFRPHDHNSSIAFYDRNGISCGVLLIRPDADEPGLGALRFTPGYQLPRGTRGARAWKRFIFGLDDDEAMQLNLDTEDGEVRLTFVDHNLTTPEQVEIAINRYVDLCTEVYPQVVEYVAGKRAIVELSE